jgi:hypothetical protein
MQGITVVSGIKKKDGAFGHGGGGYPETFET